MSYMMPKYDTPFLTMAAQNIAQGLERRGANRQRQEMGMLAGKANMGDQMALQELYMYSPEMASQTQAQQEQAAQARQQAAMAEREKRRQRRLDFQGKYEEGLSKAFRAENYEDALEIMQQTVAPYAEILDVEAIIRDRFTPSTFKAGKNLSLSEAGKTGRFRTIDAGNIVEVYDSKTRKKIREVEKGTTEHEDLMSTLKAEKLEADAQLKELKAEQEQIELKKTQQKQDAQTSETVGLVESILKNPSFEDVVGQGIRQRLPTISGESQDLLNDFDRLTSALTAENLDLMSGVLSESDIKLLKDLSSGLNLIKNDQGQTIRIAGSKEGVETRLKGILEKLKLFDSAPKAKKEETTEEARSRLSAQFGEPRKIGRFVMEISE